MKSIKDLLIETEDIFRQNDVPDAKLDVEILLSELLAIPRLELFLHYQECLPENQLKTFEEQVKLRSSRVPLQHILKKAYFYESEFYVDENVLIPRFDTEILCKEAIQKINDFSYDVLDLCTGSGCIAITIAQRCPNARVSAIDISMDALAVAKKNAKALQQSIRFLQNDLLDGITEQFDFIISNPPYIPSKEICQLQEEVLYDPLLALDGGKTGLDIVNRILKACATNLRAGGYLMMELGNNQCYSISSILEKSYSVRILQDWQGNDRFIIARKKGE